MLVAVETWVKRDHDAEWKRWTGWLEHIAAKVKTVDGVTTEIAQPDGLSNKTPSLRDRAGTARSSGVDGDVGRRARCSTASRASRMTAAAAARPAIDRRWPDRRLDHALHDGRGRRADRRRPPARRAEQAAGHAGEDAGRAGRPTSPAAGTCRSSTRRRRPRTRCTCARAARRSTGAHQGDFVTRDLTGIDRRRRGAAAQRRRRAGRRRVLVHVHRHGRRRRDVRHARHGRVPGRDVDGEAATPGGGGHEAMLMLQAHRRGLLAAMVAGAGRSRRQARRPPAAAEVRPAAPRRPRHRRAEQRSTPCATSRSPAARSRRSRRSIPPPTPARPSTSSGLYVTPGPDRHPRPRLHRHRRARTRTPATTASTPTASRFRVGVTTVVDAGGAGWRNFEDFKDRVIDRSRTRVLAFLNIVGNGMRGGKFEQRPRRHGGQADRRDGAEAQGHRSSASRPRTTPVPSGRRSSAPSRPAPIAEHPGDGRLRQQPARHAAARRAASRRSCGRATSTPTCTRACGNELVDGKPNPGMIEGRKRGVIFDVGHGGGSFVWRVAVPAMKAGFLPDSISTDLHISSMNAGMKDMLNVMGKFLALGVPLDDGDRAVDLESGARDQAGGARPPVGRRASPTSPCCASRRGDFGFIDMYGARLAGTQRLVAEMTLQGRQDRLRPERAVDAPTGRRCPRTTGRTGDARVGRDEEVTWPSRTRRRRQPPIVPEGRAGGRRRRGRGRARGSGPGHAAAAGEEGALVRRQAAREDAALQRHRPATAA